MDITIQNNTYASKLLRILWSFLLSALPISFVLMFAATSLSYIDLNSIFHSTYTATDKGEVAFYSAFLVAFSLLIANINKDNVRKSFFWISTILMGIVVFIFLTSHSSGGFDLAVPFALMFIVPPVLLFIATYSITRLMYNHVRILKVTLCLLIFIIIFNLIRALPLFALLASA